MRVHDCNWLQLEDYLSRDDRIVLPLGSTEQHAYLSLGTDGILAERVAVEAAEPLGVPVLPVLAYGITTSFAAFPGSISLRAETHLRVVRELLDAVLAQGFRRVLVVNGHGGNGPTRTVLWEWLADHEGAQAIWHEWYSGPRVTEVAEEIGGRTATHANWFENFPWTRLAGVELPREPKPRCEERLGSPAQVRDDFGDGSWGGPYAVADEDVLRMWRAGVEETRNLLEHGWRA
jgi:creatinine amidohydrolase